MRKPSRLVTVAAVVGLLAAAGCGRHEDPLGAAQIHIERGRYREAIASLAAAPPEVRNTYNAQMVLARAYLAIEEMENSEKAYEAAAGLDKEQIDPLLGLADIFLRRAAKALKEGDETAAASFRVRAQSHCQTALAIDDSSPRAARVHAMLGQIYAHSNRADDAINAHKKAIELDPANVDRKLDLARLYHAIGRPSEAAQLVDEALARDADLAGARLLRAQFILTSDKEEAKKELRLALTSKRLSAAEQAEAIRLLAYLCWETGELEEAKERVKQLENAGAHVRDARFILGAIYMQENRPEDAEKTLKPLEQLDHVPALMHLAAAQQQLGKEHQAINVYERIVTKLDPKYVPARLRLAGLRLNRGMFDEAMAHCEAVLAEQPAQPLALRYKARIHREPSSRYHSYEMALACYRKLLAHNAESPSVNLDIAELYLDMNRPAAAESRAMLAGAQDDSARFRLILGRAYLLMHVMGAPDAPEKGNLQKAVDNLKLACAKDPSSPLAVLQLANAHLMEQKPEAAIAVLRPFISQKPRTGEAYIRLAAVYESQSNLPKAIETLENAVRVAGIEKEDALRSALGRAYFLNGERKKAIETWQKLATAAGRHGIGVSVGLAAALAMEGEFDKALTQAEVVAHEAREGSMAGPLVAACIAIQAGDLDKARQFLMSAKYPSTKERAIRLDFPEQCRQAGDSGREAASLIGRGILHIEFQRPETAATDLQKAAQLLPSSALPHYLLASAYQYARRFRDAVATYEGIFRQFPRLGFPHFQLALLSRELSEQIDVKQQVELALDLDPELVAAHLLMAELQLQRAATAPNEAALNAAVRHATEAVKLDGGTMASLEILARAHTEMADLRRTELLTEEAPAGMRAKEELARRSRDEAAKALQTLSDRFPRSVRAAKARLRFHIVQRDWATAAGLATQFLQQEEWKDDHDLQLLAATAFASRNEFDKAREILTAILRVNPANVNAHRQLAAIHLRSNQPAAGILALQRALQLNPSDPAIAFDLAEACLNHGNPEQAASVYRSMLTSTPDDDRTTLATTIRRNARLGVARSIMAMAIKGRQAEDKMKLLKDALDMLTTQSDPAAGTSLDPVALVLQARILHEMGETDRALQACEKCLESDPKYAPALYTKVFLQYESRQYDDAVKTLVADIIPARHNDPEAYAQLALVALARGQTGDSQRAAAAAAQLDDLLKRHKRANMEPTERQDAYYRGTRIIALIAAGAFPQARTEAQDVPNLERPVRDALLSLIDFCARDVARAQQLVGQYSAALLRGAAGDRARSARALKQAAEIVPGNLFLLHQLTETLATMGDLQQLSEIREKMTAAAEQPGANAPAAYQQQLYLRLVESYQAQIPSLGQAAIDQGIAASKRALSRWPDHTELLDRLATLHIAAKQTERAIAVLEQIAAKTPEGSASWLSARRRLAYSYDALGQPGKVLEQCRLIEPHVKPDAAWLNNSAWFYAVTPPAEGGDLGRAVTLAERAKEIDPNDPHIRDTLGWIYHLAGRYQKAKAELEYAAQELPRNASVAYHLGANEVKLGNIREAAQILNRAMSIHRNPERSTRLSEAEEEQCRKLIERVTKELGGSP